MFSPFSGFAARQKLYTRDLYLVSRVLVESWVSWVVVDCTKEDLKAIIFNVSAIHRERTKDKTIKAIKELILSR
jgi:hypothetical protein